MAERPIVVAHRCNTRAKLLGVPEGSWVEVDLMLTADKILVIGHPIEHEVRHIMSSVLVDRWVDDERPIFFGELVQIVRERNLSLVLDLKHEGMGDIAARCILEEGLGDKVVIIAWSQENLRAVKEFYHGARTCWCVKGALIDPAGDAERIGFNILAVGHFYLTPRFLIEMRKLEALKFCFFGVNDVDVLEIVVDAGADMILTDHPCMIGFELDRMFSGGCSI